MKEIIEKIAKFSLQMELNGDLLATTHDLAKGVNYLFEETRETEVALAIYEVTDSEADEYYLEEIIDGFGDTAFVAIAGLYKSFIHIGDSHDEAVSKTAEVLNRICNANLAKLTSEGKVLKNEKGKVIKPEGWMAPTYHDLL